MSILEARSVSKSYENHEILHDISLPLHKGEVHVLLGPSGSGKTTLLRLLAGFLDADKGTIIFDGKKLEGPNKRLVPGYEEIRLVHQDFQLKFKMTVAENIRYELLSYIKEYQQERIELLLDLFNIEHLRDTDVSQLSGGERQRVAIARGLAHEPDVILMDEPFSNLDLGTKSALLTEIRHLAKETDTAVLLVTHDTRDALEVGDIISVLHNGRMIRQGTPIDIYRQPGTKVVANLFGPFNTNSHTLQNLSKVDVPNGNYGVWPEDIMISEDGESCKVVHQTFMGNYWKVTLKANQETIICYTKHEITSDHVKISIASMFELADQNTK